MLGYFVRRAHEALTSVRDAFLPRPHGVFASETISELPLEPATVRKTAGVLRLSELGARQVQVISPNLFDDHNVLARSLRQALETGSRLWVLTVFDHATHTALEAKFGHHLVALGPEASDGRRAYGITPEHVASWLLIEFPGYAWLFEGVDAASLPHRILARLTELMVPVRQRSKIARLLRNPRTYVYLAVFVYSSLRALPVVFVKEFHGSLFVLWSIDILTAIPYTWGIIAMISGATRRIRMAGTFVTMATFVAPYVYFGMCGRDYPPFVILIISLLIVGSVGIEWANYRQERLLERRYAAEVPRTFV